MYALNMMAHFRLLAEAAEKIGVRAELEFESLRVEVSGRGRYFEFEPEFLDVKDGHTELGRVLEAQTVAFTGWRHVARRNWDLALDKRAFKEFCTRHGLRTPRAYATAAETAANVLVKQLRPATEPGEQGVIRGPFAPKSIGAENFQPNAGWFLEEFILGDIAMAHYCEGELFSIEARKKPRVTGDGYSTVKELIECAKQPVGEVDWKLAENLLRLQGGNLDSVLPAGREMLVDVRFWSPLQPFTTADRNVLQGLQGSPIHQQLADAGPIFWGGIPESIRANAYFQVYAVVDAQQNVWFIDMHTDRYVDPHSYDPTLRRLFGVPSQSAALPSDVATAATMVPLVKH
ncbi:MAG TPA: hypothetical protein VGM84_05115 [Steroidobacteraceae bacterium]|jgi:hypothetical protein